MLKDLKKNREKVKKLVESKSFDLFIMLLICLDAILFGFMTSEEIDENFGGMIFILDRLCLAIFMVEMILKLYVYRTSFFKSRWNTFDLTVIVLSSFSIASYFIILRTFRLFRLIKYINRFPKLKKILTILGELLPNFVALLLVFAVFLYVFAIIAVSLFGNVFMEFATLGNALFTLLQVFTLDGWSSEIARPVMTVFPHAWLFFMSFLLVSFLLSVSFVMSIIDEMFHRVRCDSATEIVRSAQPAVKAPIQKKKTATRKRRMSPARLAK